MSEVFIVNSLTTRYASFRGALACAAKGCYASVAFSSPWPEREIEPAAASA